MPRWAGLRWCDPSRHKVWSHIQCRLQESHQIAAAERYSQRVSTSKWCLSAYRRDYLWRLLQLHWQWSRRNEMHRWFTFWWSHCQLRVASRGKPRRMQDICRYCTFISWYLFGTLHSRSALHFIERAAAAAAASKSENPGEFICPGAPKKDANGQLIPHPKFPHETDCQKFYLCLNGIDKRQLSCDDDKVFNEATETCDSPENVEGWWVGGDEWNSTPFCTTFFFLCSEDWSTEDADDDKSRK